ncbi:ATP-dependent Clp protease proteolytic subunit-related protein 2- chloroplastic [Striga hermonthica]|uniref:ATP-dependent Clp protease proteolytic subunit n=1 Tax=Striga hermonthica TaxID=68872 RepID=A0A9N7RRR3_STRHE|nr:ATP-dependent Clp protease proteolytic subunit-related protein 2- chloroplastic [Striga hermonthica]
MAVTSASCLNARLARLPQPSLSCAGKGFEGLRVSSSFCGARKPNSTVDFHVKVYKSVHSRRCGKPTRACVTMMPIGVPQVAYLNHQDGSWSILDLWNALYRERIVFLAEHITENYGNEILATMLYLDTIDDDQKLYVFISSSGGDLSPTMAVYDTMQSLRTRVGTHCFGYTSGLTPFILAAGDKGSRTSMPLTHIVLQSPAGAARGRSDDVQNEANELLRIRDYLFKELAEKTGQPIDKIYKDLSYLKTFNGKEAVEYGLIDRVLSPTVKKPKSFGKRSTVKKPKSVSKSSTVGLR